MSDYEKLARAAWNVWDLDHLMANEPNKITSAKITARVAAEIQAAEDRGRQQGVEEASARLAVWDDHLRAVGSVHACERLLEAAKAAYEHLDSFGVVAGGTPREHESQRRVFDMLRPFVSRPKQLPLSGPDGSGEAA